MKKLIIVLLVGQLIKGMKKEPVIDFSKTSYVWFARLSKDERERLKTNIMKTDSVDLKNLDEEQKKFLKTLNTITFFENTKNENTKID